LSRKPGHVGAVAFMARLRRLRIIVRRAHSFTAETGLRVTSFRLAGRAMKELG
jgi:hypothetical protein